MISTLARSRKRTLAGLAVGALTAGAIVFGIASPASAFTDPDVSGCLNFTHSSPFFSTTQKVVATNECAVGPFGFRVSSWYGIATETSPCLQAGAHRTAGWQWTKGRKYYAIIGC